MAEAKKETLYIEADEEITAVIDKMVNAKSKIVAIVLPKHATVFQSTVNMRLLQKAAKSAKKNIALITSDPSILAIAGAAGVHVAKTPTSKPVIPAVATAAGATVALKSSDDTDEEATTDNTEKEAAEDEDAIELDNTSDEAVKPAAEDGEAKSKNKTLKIPDFSSFRVKMGLAIGGVVLLIALWFIGFVLLPTATVSITTDVSNIPLNIQATAQIGGTEVNAETDTIPATQSQVEKIDSVTVQATGEKDIGQQATGTMTLTNCINDGEDKVVPAGTQFTSEGLVFVTTEQVILDFAIFAGSTCLSADFGRSQDVGVQASQPGTQYNLSARSYSSSISGITAEGTAMTGGTTENVQVVSQDDVDRATAELNGRSKTQAISELELDLREQGLRPISETLLEGTPDVTFTPAIDEQATEVSVTMKVTYNMLGISNDDLNAVLDAAIDEQLGDTQQNIRSNGIDTVQFQVQPKTDDANQPILIETVAVIGPDLSVMELKESLAGKPRGEIESELEAIDGVRSVTVEYSPGWITTTPKSADKINVVLSEEE